MTDTACPFVDGNCTEECQAYLPEGVARGTKTCAIVKGISNISISLMLICEALNIRLEYEKEERQN